MPRDLYGIQTQPYGKNIVTGSNVGAVSKQTGPPAGAYDDDEGEADLPPQPIFTPAPLPSPSDRRAANDAAFGRAKERTAVNSRASIDALRNAMAASNRLGSGAEMRGTTAVVTRGQGNLDDLVRAQTIEDLRQTEHETDRNFAAQNANARTQLDSDWRGYPYRVQQAQIDYRRKNKRPSIDAMRGYKGIGGGWDPGHVY